MNMINYWTHNGRHLNNLPDDVVGFVYIIYYDNRCKYIGKKLARSERKKKPLKGMRSNARRMVMTEHNWKDYIGSSKDIPDEARIQSKVILHLCTNKRTMTYLEEKEMFLRDVLLDKWYYNKSIAGRYYDNCEDGLYIPPTESHTQLIMEM